MLEIITTDDWVFSVDIDITKEYYKTNNGHCDCAARKNYCQAIRSYSQELTDFLEQFGIDVQKPIYTMWFEYGGQSKIVDYTAYYAVHGTAVNGEYKIDFGTINIVVQAPENAPDTEIQRPYFVFEIFNLLLPWMLPDDIEFLETQSKKEDNIQTKKESFFITAIILAIVSFCVFSFAELISQIVWGSTSGSFPFWGVGLICMVASEALLLFIHIRKNKK